MRIIRWLALIVFLVVAASTFFPNQTPGPVTGTPSRPSRLDVEVTRIRNGLTLNSRGWSAMDCTVRINNDFSAAVQVLPVNFDLVVEYARFTRRDGFRFNPATYAVREIYVACERPEFATAGFSVR